MCVEYCSLKIFEFTKTNSYGGEDDWVTPRLVTEKTRNDPEGKFAFPPPHRIAPFLKVLQPFFVTTFAVYLPKELLSPAAATRAAACAGKFHYIHIFATTPCLCLCFYLSLSLTACQFGLFTYFCRTP